MAREYIIHANSLCANRTEKPSSSRHRRGSCTPASEMITGRSISREVNESIPPPNAKLGMVLEGDVAVPANAFDNGTASAHATRLEKFVYIFA